MLTFAIIAGVLVFWFVLIWRVGVERGWVGLTDADRLRLRFRASVARIAIPMAELSYQIGKALEPAIRKTAAQLVALVEAWKRAQDYEQKRIGYVTPFDDRLIPLASRPTCPEHSWRQPLGLFDEEEGWTCPLIGCGYRTAA